MKNLNYYVYHILTGAGVIADHWFGMEEAGNLSLAVIWLVILAVLLGVAISNPEDIKDTQSKNSRLILRLLSLGNVLILLAAGWFGTGYTLILSWAALYAKRNFMKTSKSK